MPALLTRTWRESVVAWTSSARPRTAASEAKSARWVTLVAGRGGDRRRRGRQLGVAAVDVDLHPQPGEALGDAAADPVGGPGDEGDAAAQLLAHGTRRTILPGP
jgi:hypothetical protein